MKTFVLYYDGVNQITEENGVYKLYVMTMDLRDNHLGEVLDREYVMTLTKQQVLAITQPGKRELVKLLLTCEH